MFLAHIDTVEEVKTGHPKPVSRFSGDSEDYHSCKAAAPPTKSYSLHHATMGYDSVAN